MVALYGKKKVQLFFSNFYTTCKFHSFNVVIGSMEYVTSFNIINKKINK